MSEAPSATSVWGGWRFAYPPHTLPVIAEGVWCKPYLGPIRVAPTLPAGGVNGEVVAEPEGRLFAGSGSLLPAPGASGRTLDTGGTWDVSEHPATMKPATSMRTTARMYASEVENVPHNRARPKKAEALIGRVEGCEKHP